MKHDIIRQVRTRSRYMNSTSGALLKRRLKARLKDLERVLQKAEDRRCGCFAYCPDPTYYPSLIPPDLNRYFIRTLKQAVRDTEERLKDLTDS